MTITIETDSLPEDLSPVEYVILYCIHFNIPSEYMPQELYKLQDKKYLKLTDKIELRDKAIQLLTPSHDAAFQKFLEVFGTYPIKTYSGRRLRPVKLDAKETLDLFQKYKKRVLEKGKHSYVKACLEAELKQRKMANTLEYMHEMITWVNGEKWDRFAPEENQVPEKTERVDSI